MKKEKKKEKIAQRVIADMRDPNYLGMHLLPVVTEKERLKRATHPIFLLSLDTLEDTAKVEKRLHQIVNVYEHTLYDFEANAKRITEHMRKYYGANAIHAFMLGQTIQFRVYPEQEEPFNLSLFAFMMNYTMIIPLIILGADMTEWTPWVPTNWSDGGWWAQMCKYIRMVRDKANMRAICECLELSKYLMNHWTDRAANHLGLSISNNEFIELMKRFDFARETITSTFDIPDGTSPGQLESMINDRAGRLLDMISQQEDLNISIYARNGLFNVAQFKEFAVHISHKPDLYGNTLPFTHQTNIIMGTKDPRAHVIDAYGGRKAEIIKLYVSDAGALERSLCMMSSIRYVDTDYECDSQHFRERVITSADVLDKLDGRVYTLDPKSDEYYILDPEDLSLIGEKIYLKTPITCTHPRRHEGVICSACYGKLMANLNCDLHVGKLAALNSSDDMEQTLLSAKHALNTNTQNVVFDAAFDEYFYMSNCRIMFSQNILDASVDVPGSLDNLYLEFNPATMKKHQDGEGRQFDRSITEIIIYNAMDDTKTVIKEESGLEIYLSPDFVEQFYLPATAHSDDKKEVRISIGDIVDSGKSIIEEVFEYEHPNQELAEAVLTLEGILTKNSRINAFDTFNECLDTLNPLFVKGGIHIPELQCEMIIANMIFTPDFHRVDWTEKNPEYVFCTIDKSIQHSESALVGVLYEETISQLSGAYNTYNKRGTSNYDWCVLERGSSTTSTKAEELI